MSVAAKLYSCALTTTFHKEAQWIGSVSGSTTGDAIKMALGTAYTPNQNTHKYYDQAPFPAAWTEVAPGGGYTTGGTVIGTNAAWSDSSNTWTINFANGSWSGATFTAAFAVVYDSTPGSNKPLLLYIDFGGNLTVTGGTFAVNWTSSAVQFTVS